MFSFPGQNNQDFQIKRNYFKLFEQVSYLIIKTLALFIFSQLLDKSNPTYVYKSNFLESCTSITESWHSFTNMYKKESWW